MPRSALRSAGFTLTELMVIVVIVGVLSAVATPYLMRDRKASAAVEFADQVTREMQRARLQALAERLPVRASIFRDRVEVRSWLPGARPGDRPRAPASTDPVLRSVPAQLGVDVLDVLTTPAPAPTAPVLTNETPIEIDFNSQGQMQFVGEAPLSPAYLFVRSTLVDGGHPDSHYRIEVTSLTGYVSLHQGWN